MLIDYDPTKLINPRFMTRGVILNSLFELGDLEQNEQWTTYPIFAGRYPSGVCDSLENLLKVYPELSFNGACRREFVVNMVCIDRDAQEKFDGWRWDHWGDYIGKQTPTTEYLYDEPVIDRVFCFKIYEKKD